MAKTIDDSNTRNAKEVLRMLEQNPADIEIEKLNEAAKKLPSELRNIVEDASAHISLRKNLGSKTASLIATYSDSHPDVIKKRKALQEYSRETETVCSNAISTLQNYISGKPFSIPKTEQRAPVSYEQPQKTQPKKDSADLEEIVEKALASPIAEINVHVEALKAKFNDVNEYATKKLVELQKAVNELPDSTKIKALSKELPDYAAKIDAIGKALPEVLEQLQSFSDTAKGLALTKEELESLQTFKADLASLPSVSDLEGLLQKVDDMKQKMNQITPAELSAYVTLVNELKTNVEKIKETYDAIAQAKYSKEELQRVRALIVNLDRLNAYDMEALERKVGELNTLLPQLAGLMETYHDQFTAAAEAAQIQAAAAQQPQPTSTPAARAPQVQAAGTYTYDKVEYVRGGFLRKAYHILKPSREGKVLEVYALPNSWGSLTVEFDNRTYKFGLHSKKTGKLLDIVQSKIDPQVLRQIAKDACL